MKVLITKRFFTSRIEFINKCLDFLYDEEFKSCYLKEVDACGTRVVFECLSRHTGKQKSLPKKLFDLIKKDLIEQIEEAELSGEPWMLHRQDPGLGIYIPEIDDPVAKAGGIPDGVLAFSKDGIASLRKEEINHPPTFIPGVDD